MPYHSKLPSTKVYHTNDKCTEGNNIEHSNRVGGKGGKKHCKNC